MLGCPGERGELDAGRGVSMLRGKGGLGEVAGLLLRRIREVWRGEVRSVAACALAGLWGCRGVWAGGFCSVR